MRKLLDFLPALCIGASILSYKVIDDRVAQHTCFGIRDYYNDAVEHLPRPASDAIFYLEDQPLVRSAENYGPYFLLGASILYPFRKNIKDAYFS